jgi:hypothetical protein
MKKPGSFSKPLRSASVDHRVSTPMEFEMDSKRIAAVALLTVVLPVATASTSFALGRGPGVCTPPAGKAVGAAGPAMSGGQLMAGVGQCRRVGTLYHAHSAYRYGYRPAYRYAYRPAYTYGTGFWPTDVAAGIVGGAVGAAGAIAAAPFGAGPYAYYNGPYAY